MKKQLFTLLTLLVMCVTGAWGEEILFSAVVTSEWSVPANTTNSEITNTYATISGGKMYVTNDQSEAKSLLATAGNQKCFSMTNSGTKFKVVLDKALQVGDKINGKTYNNSKSAADRGIFLSTATSRPSSCTAALIKSSATSGTWEDLPEYTVEENDGICGLTEFYIYRGTGNTTYFKDFTITRTAVAPGEISFSPAAGSVAAGTSITLTSSGATTIEYQWGASAIDSDGDWTSVETYSSNNKPVVPAVGSTNTVLSVKATNANGSTYGSAAYTPVKMALKTIYSFTDGIGEQEVSAADATITGATEMKLSNTNARIKLTPATGFKFKNGDAITFSGSMGNDAKIYGIKYGSDTNLGTNLMVEKAGDPCFVSGILSLTSDADNLYIGRYDGTTTYLTAMSVRRLAAATSEAYSGVKINGSTATADNDYTIEGTTITLAAEHTFTAIPNVALVNHIIFSDASTEDQSVNVAFGAPDGEYYTGTATIDGTTYTVKAPCGNINALKVEYKSGDATVKTENLNVTGLKVGASYTVPFRMYVENDGALYQTTKNNSNPYYGDAVTLTYNTTVTKSVSPVDLKGGTIELFEDLDGSSSENASVRASNCSSYNNTAYTSESDLPAGVYNFIVKAYSRGRGSSVKVGKTKIFDLTEVGGSWTDKTFENVLIPEDGKLIFVAGDNGTYDPIDILIAIRTGDATISTTIASSGYSSLGSAYGLDFANATTSTENAAKLTAFAATESSKTSVKLVSIDEAPAETGVILKGTAGATYTIPVKADAAALAVTNLLHAAVTATPILASTSYIMQGGKFHLVTEDSEVPAGKAYLVPGTSQARELTFIFDGETTGINVATEKNNTTTGVYYNLAGQRVNQPAKGIYVVDGKKVIK